MDVDLCRQTQWLSMETPISANGYEVHLELIKDVMSERYQSNQICMKKLKLWLNKVEIEADYKYGADKLIVGDWGSYVGFWYFEKYPDKISEWFEFYVPKPLPVI